ncbi:ribose transport system ATP-binding protein [Marininema mesophilum]|uniref:Ribose transport system ATP-binding protein n=1 Tax=Marininema mesophilum TaxID=1048340 RepID=A0A1H2ZZ45_9BACL|nr:sugar ABC transporter ATP-binding protein [Marininema mesophilum]SDX22792.1 ribose transport system ATP-binding protein [Marininema mesophilum]
MNHIERGITITAPLLSMVGIHKSFARVHVLKHVDFTLQAGEIHALLGENGAGKSTLIKVLSGIYSADQGRIHIDGKEQVFKSPRAALVAGVGVIHQEFNLVPHLSICENIFLGREHLFGRGWIRWRKMRREALLWLEKIGLLVDPSCKVGELSIGQQQMVEIAKALSFDAQILVLDEPTAALTQSEKKALFATLCRLREKQVGMIYISHRLEEIEELCDRITVLRNGESIGTRMTKETSMDELVGLMVGRKIQEQFPRELTIKQPAERLRVEGLTQQGKVSQVSFSIQAGEILGMAGLIGAGRTEMANLLFGVQKQDAGEIWLDGKQIRIRHPRDAIQAGLAYVTEDRKGEGLVLSRSVKENFTLPSLASFTKGGFIRKQQENEMAEKLMRQLGIRSTGIEQKVGFLSGGNQQKVAIGKWLLHQPKVWILDEPTRGVDIGAKREIYQLINQLTEQGMAILLISSDLPEVLGMSDRILVMREGKRVALFNREDADEEKVMQAASGGGSLLA